MLTSPPKDATHYSDGYSIVMFWKHVFEYQGLDSEDEMIYHTVWAYWDENMCAWIKDPTTCSRNFKTIDTYKR